MKKLLFLLFVFSLQVQAGLTDLQREILNEPVTMMDLFIDRSEKRLSNLLGDELSLESYKNEESKKIAIYPIETIDGNDFTYVLRNCCFKAKNAIHGYYRRP